MTKPNLINMELREQFELVILELGAVAERLVARRAVLAAHGSDAAGGVRIAKRASRADVLKLGSEGGE